jgi:hypothetical protein
MSEARREMLKIVAAQREIAIRGTAGKGRLRIFAHDA